MRGEHVGDARARVPQADGRIGVDAFGAQPLDLRAAFVEFDRAVLKLHSDRRVSVTADLRLRSDHWPACRRS